MQFFGVVHHEAGSAYGVTFPDVPGCFAAADEAQDILKNAMAALDDFFSDEEKISKPRNIEEIGDAAADDLAAGAYLIAVPLVERITKSERVNISLERGLLRAIDEAASQSDLNRSAFLAMAARNQIAAA